MKRRDLIVSGLSTATILGVNRAARAGNAQLDPDFPRLFNGRDLQGLKFILQDGKTEPGDTFKVGEMRALVCAGKPNGYWYTEKSYKNYILRFEYRFKRPEGLADENAFLGNSGYLIHIAGEHKIWPKCVEVQGMNRDVCAIFAIGGATGPRANGDPEVRKTARKPVGEWNAVEIISKDGMLTASLNGTKIAEGGPYDVKEGPIGFQSEGAEVHWRRLRLKQT